jgi:DNA-binding MarR family transcriptional regulator
LRAAVIDTDLGDHNCLHTEPIGALNDPHEGLALTLAVSRCLFTIDRLGTPDVCAIAQALDLDLGYVSRLVTRLERAGRVGRTARESDRRRRVVRLTDDGAALLPEVARRSNGGRLDRAITSFTAAETGAYQRADEDHFLRLYSETEVRAVIERAGFEVEVIAGYEAPGGRVQLSGWYVVQAGRNLVGVS